MKTYRFPPMSAARLFREAINSYLLARIHQGPSSPDEEPPDRPDPDTMPWPQLQGLCLSHLRHRYTSYDAERAKGADRETLRSEIYAAALRTYSFLRSDPRPLPREPERRYYDFLAARLDALREREHALVEMLSFASTREGRPHLLECLAGIRQEIAEFTKRLTMPELSEDGEQVFATFQSTPTKEYCWLGHTLHPCHLAYAGYLCPQCKVGVYFTKQPKALGQGRRVWIWSCHCVVYFAPAAHGKIEPITANEWQDFAGTVAGQTVSPSRKT